MHLADGASHLGRRHVVEEDDIGPGARGDERSLDRRDLDLDGRPGRRPAPRRGDRRSDPRGLSSEEDECTRQSFI